MSGEGRRERHRVSRLDPAPSVTQELDRREPHEPWWRYARPDALPPLVAATPPPEESDPPGPADEPGPEPEGDRYLPPGAEVRSGAGAAVIACAALVVLLVSAHFFHTALLSRILVPVVGVSGALAIGRVLARRHPDEPWLGKIFFLGVCAKLVASVFRYRTLVDSFGNVGDATVYDKYGRRLVAFWMGQGPEPFLDNLRKSNFVRWFAGAVYYVFGIDMIAGFLVFGLIAFVGSYLWYRATVEAVPFIDARLYMVLVVFAPSILFWPSSIGKESLMQFGIGSAALGTAHLFNGRLVRGLVVAFPGAWLLYTVRPHLLGLVTFAAAVAYLVGRGKRSAETGGRSTWKPLGLIVLAFLTFFTISQGAKSLGLQSLSLESVNSELEATSVSTSQGGSSFNPGDTSITPIALPRAITTVLLRPFPWEVESLLQILASLEGVLLVGFIVVRRRSLGLSLRRIRSTPFLFYCWTLTLLYALTFQAFANFGLLVRQRSLVLPALYVLLCLDVRRAEEPEERELPAPEEEGAPEPEYFVPYGTR